MAVFGLITPMLEQLGLVLIHSLWQIGLLAIIARSIASYVCGTASQRYIVKCAFLLLMLLVPAGTFFSGMTGGSSVSNVRFESESSQYTTDSAVAAQGESEGTGANSSVETHHRNLQQSFCGLIALGWLIGSLLMLTRAVAQWGRACQFQVVAAHVPAWLEEILVQASSKLGIKRNVRLGLSDVVSVPTLVGVFRPVILLPPSAMLGLTPSQLELIILHELAHVQRFDFALNVAQSVVESLLFFHPCVWWLSQQIREEREFIVDDIVVSKCDRASYVDALLRTENHRTAEVPALAANAGSLAERTRRLVETNERRWYLTRPSYFVRYLAATFCLLAVFMIASRGQPYESRNQIIEVAGNTMSNQQLVEAVAANDIETLSQLLGEGANVNAVADTNTGMTLLGLAAKNGHLEVVHFLLEQGADPLLPTDHDTVLPCALAYANECWKTERVIRTRIVKNRIATDPSFIKNPGNTLHSAAHYSEEEIVRALLDAGVDIEQEHPGRGGKPLHWATEGNVRICNWLLDLGADINSRVVADDERNGMTPLIYCAWWCGDTDGCIDIAKNLIQRGADITLRDAEGKSAVDRAKQQGHLRLAQFLEDNGCS